MQWSGHVDRKTGFICVMFGVLAALGMSVHIWPELQVGGLSNPDSYMRLARLRDMLDSGTTVYGVARDGSGHGTVLHWSHLIDGFLSLLAVPFGLFLEQNDALHAAALIFGPLNIAALSFAIVWAGAPFADRNWLWLGAIMAAISPAIASYGLAGVVHHHVSIVLVAVASWGWAARLISGHAGSESGLVLGAWAGLGVWLSPETVPLTMPAFGALGFAWILYPARGDIARSVGLAGVSFVLVTVLALLVDPPAAGIFALEIDRLSLLFAGLALAVAATGAGLWSAHSYITERGGRLTAACAIGAICCTIWATTVHGVLFQENMLLDEQQRGVMFERIGEMRPVAGVPGALHFVFSGVLALALTILLALRRRSLLLGYVAVCLGGALAVGAAHVRFAAYPEAAGAIALPIALTLAEDATRKWRAIGQSTIRMGTILLFILTPFLGRMLDNASNGRVVAATAAPLCRVDDAVAMLASHPGAVVLADVSDTPELLYKTPVRTVGSLYHRDVAAFSRLRAAWRVAPSATVPPEFDAAEISLVLGCRSLLRSPLVEDLATATLSDQVTTGNPPPWLMRIDENAVSGQVLYEVARTGKSGVLARAR